MRLLWTTPSLQSLCPARLPMLSAAPTSVAMLTFTVSGFLNQYCMPFSNASNIIMSFLKQCLLDYG